MEITDKDTSNINDQVKPEPPVKPEKSVKPETPVRSSNRKRFL